MNINETGVIQVDNLDKLVRLLGEYSIDYSVVACSKIELGKDNMVIVIFSKNIYNDLISLLLMNVLDGDDIHIVINKEIKYLIFK